MKRKLLPALLLVIAFSLTSCANGQTPEEKIYGEIHEFLHIDPSGQTLVLSRDTHGGFHGDGMSYAEISFSDSDVSEKLSADSAWKALPLSENISILVYGNGTNGPYLKNESEEALFPNLKNGFYCFIDRQNDKTEPYSDANVLERSSFNIVIAVYDTDTDTLYWSKFDT